MRCIHKRHFDHAIRSSQGPREDNSGAHPAGKLQHVGIQTAANVCIRQAHNRHAFLERSFRPAQSISVCRNCHQPDLRPGNHEPVAVDDSAPVSDDHGLRISQFEEWPQQKLHQRLMNPAIQRPGLRIGCLKNVNSVAGIRNGEGPDGGELPEPMVQHYGFCQETVAAQRPVQSALQPADGQRGAVPVAIRHKPCDEPDLPPKMEP